MTLQSILLNLLLHLHSISYTVQRFIPSAVESLQIVSPPLFVARQTFPSVPPFPLHSLAVCASLLCPFLFSLSFCPWLLSALDCLTAWSRSRPWSCDKKPQANLKSWSHEKMSSKFRFTKDKEKDNAISREDPPQWRQWQSHHWGGWRRNPSSTVPSPLSGNRI